MEIYDVGRQAVAKASADRLETTDDGVRGEMVAHFPDPETGSVATTYVVTMTWDCGAMPTPK